MVIRSQIADTPHCNVAHLCFCLLISLYLSYPCTGSSRRGSEESGSSRSSEKKQMLLQYFRDMTMPEPFVVRKGREFEAHRDRLRGLLLESIGLSPLPERVPLDSRKARTLDHQWCTIQSISYRLWPGVRVTGLLYIPKDLHERPAPAVLCPHGHWKDFFAHSCVQKRCLTFAKMGYVVFCPPQLHYEDLMLGVSHQTIGVWNNMRALDYLESLPQVDGTRIGVCGCSGGGLQTQMLVALDHRVKAATIAGYTCNYRHIMAFEGIHCRCNHFPNVMCFTDHPEISTLGFPTPVQYLTMNDWTKNFAKQSFPTIKRIYEANGMAGFLGCFYEPTIHEYEKNKRERTYEWMEKHLRHRNDTNSIAEPSEIETFAPETLLGLCPKISQEQKFPQISKIYRRKKGYKVPTITSKHDWLNYRRNMIDVLADLLGVHARLPRQGGDHQRASREVEDGLIIERVNCPTEGSIVIAVIVVHRQNSKKRLPIIFLYDQYGPEELLADTRPASAKALAMEGVMVVLPETRFIKEFGPGTAAQKNTIVWGRPFTGMACTDIHAVLDRICERPDIDPDAVRIMTRNSGAHAIAALFAAALDERIESLDLDFQDKCFRNRNLPLIPFILQHGDVLQWASLLANRELTLRNVPELAGDATWLAEIFRLLGNAGGLNVITD